MNQLGELMSSRLLPSCVKLGELGVASMGAGAVRECAHAAEGLGISGSFFGRLISPDGVVSYCDACSFRGRRGGVFLNCLGSGRGGQR